MDGHKLAEHNRLLNAAFQRHGVTRALVRAARWQLRKAKQRLDRCHIELINAAAKGTQEEQEATARELHNATLHWEFCRNQHIKKKIDRNNARMKLLQRRREFQAWMSMELKESE